MTPTRTHASQETPTVDFDTLNLLPYGIIVVNEQGTGMGLATSYAIVRRHGGDIEVESAEGAGTTVRVRLPVSPT